MSKVSFKGRKGLSVIDKFIMSFQMTSPSECWIWDGYKDKEGYGRLWTGTTYIGAHRFSYEYFKESLGDKQCNHTCNNPSCVNPAHLYAGNQGDNLIDRYNTTNKLDRSCCISPRRARFYAGEIELIRKLHIDNGRFHKISSAFVAKMFKTNQSVIHRIWHTSQWFCREGYYV